MRRKFLALLTALCMMLTLLPATAFASEQTLVVDGTNGDDDNPSAAGYRTIQAAVEAANAIPTTIEIADGTYTETITIDQGQDITLQGNSRAGTQIGLVDNQTVIIDAQGNVTLKNLTVTGPNNRNGELIGIHAYGNANLTMENVTVTDIAYFDGSGAISGVQRVMAVLVEGTGSANISHCTIKEYQKGGIVLKNSGASFITNNAITGVGRQDKNAQNGIQVGNSGTATEYM